MCVRRIERFFLSPRHKRVTPQTRARSSQSFGVMMGFRCLPPIIKQNNEQTNSEIRQHAEGTGSESRKIQEDGKDVPDSELFNFDVISGSRPLFAAAAHRYWHHAELPRYAQFRLAHLLTNAHRCHGFQQISASLPPTAADCV